MGKDGQVEKLEMEQCKEYLRKHGLRLSGCRNTLIQRIKEHQEILGGRGVEKYPLSSFVVNCKGDACAGDIVLFKQNVYGMHNGQSQSARGPSCGKRTVAGRILKESYGAAKQQHTFTIEVLWSKGANPLSPLHPLKIKGRNLYRSNTLRQRWKDEEERAKVLMEKHSRGDIARSARETRIMEKEKRKLMRENSRGRASRKDRERNHPNFLQPIDSAKVDLQAHQSSHAVNSEIMASHGQNPGKATNRDREILASIQPIHFRPSTIVTNTEVRPEMPKILHQPPSEMARRESIHQRRYYPQHDACYRVEQVHRDPMMYGGFQQGHQPQPYGGFQQVHQPQPYGGYDLCTRWNDNRSRLDMHHHYMGFKRELSPNTNHHRQHFAFMDNHQAARPI